jgi:hypothetical protein
VWGEKKRRRRGREEEEEEEGEGGVPFLPHLNAACLYLCYELNVLIDPLISVVKRRVLFVESKKTKK